MKVPDISFKQYVELEDRTLYDYYLEFGKFIAEDVFKLGPFMDRSFGFVKDIQYYFVYDKKGFTWPVFFEEVEKATGESYKSLVNRSIFELQKAILYFKEQIEIINDMESEYLGHAPTGDQIAAGINDFGAYGAFLQFDKLAGGDLLKYEEVKKLDYSFCFTKLKLEADRDGYTERYNKILNTKK